MGIGGKAVKVEESMKLPITLREKNQRGIVKQSFMVARIDVTYNTIFSRPLLNKVSAVLSPQYLLMKFKTDKGVTSIRGH